MTALSGAIRAREKSPFVYVAIDGDSFIFQKDILLRGSPSSNLSPYRHHLTVALVQYIKDQCALCDLDLKNDEWKDIDFIVRIYLNRCGLSKALRKYRSDFTAENLDQICLSFAAGGLNFDFIDAGTGEDKADILIKRDWQLYINDDNCVKIIAGVLHDGGYMLRLDLERFSANSKESRKITLLTCHSTLKVYTELPFEIIAFPDLFQTQALNPKDRGRPAYTKKYTGTLPAQESLLATAMRAAIDARETADSTNKEIEILKASLAKAEGTIQDLTGMLNHKPNDPKNNLGGIATRAGPDTAPRITSLSSIQDKLLFVCRKLMCCPPTTAAAKYWLYVDYPSGAQTRHLVELTDTIGSLQQRLSEELGMPKELQVLEIEGVKLNPDSTLESLWIGPDAHLKMRPCSLVDLLKVSESDERDGWVHVLSGGYEDAAAGKMAEKTGDLLPKLEECRKSLLGKTVKEEGKQKPVAEKPVAQKREVGVGVDQRMAVKLRTSRLPGGKTSHNGVEMVGIGE